MKSLTSACAISFALTSALLLTSSVAHAQSLPTQQLSPLPRLSTEQLDVTPPSARVTGTPGSMRIIDRSCRSLPLSDVRRRIVNAAAQEWAYFGFSIDEQAAIQPPPSSQRRRGPGMSSEDATRLADSIAGFWAATPESDWILERQNQNWETNGTGARWRDAWSAAFISWVMCESGLGDTAQFKRAIAHHTYIDQAILASDGRDTSAVFTAHEPGTREIVPGDMLCRGSRPAYRTIAERRAQLGVGARTHCDIVVKVDESNGKIMVIGGNVRGSVRLKVFPAVRDGSEPLRPLGDNGRILFAHLSLKADAIEGEALDNSPSVQMLACSAPQAMSAMPLAAAITLPRPAC
ncbi:MAG: DUF2272 domain-containing protein [Pseudohongiellaceae bacterium]